MPARYEAMKRQFIREGLSDKAAKTKAAKIFNATRDKDEAPVTRREHGEGRDRDDKRHQ